MLTLYGMPVAPNPRRVILFIHALDSKKLDIEYEQVSISKREHLSESMLSKNPFGQLPFLEIKGGTEPAVISDSHAICRYLAAVSGDTGLFGSGALDQAQVSQMDRRIKLEVQTYLLLSVQYDSERWADIRPQHPEFAASARKRGLKALNLVGDMISGSDYVCGDQLSIADITLYCLVDFGLLMKLPMTEHPAIKAHHELMNAKFSEVDFPAQ